ncbi:hypothetical protein L6164_026329 [Bauhinia variegata]|uniref:Uncharacterized protein n=1 Tax=Bauhinia variegata TaxID=167791 RepID=A0ACB9LQL9_BAUVA|nr:hypothetical protein L6164_026329 [Bauhinia variegata]
MLEDEIIDELNYYHCAYRNSSLVSLVSDIFIVLLCSLAILGLLFCQMNILKKNVIVGVHDSYWTHACDVDVINRILREKFVELYETPVLENLLEEFERSFPSLSFPPLPERGNFDLRDVLESPYFFN